MTLLEKIQSVDDEHYRRIGNLLVSYPREWSPAIGVYLSLRFQNVKLAHYLHIQNPIALWFDINGERKFLGEIYFGSDSVAEVRELLGVPSVDPLREGLKTPEMRQKLAARMEVPKRCPGLDYPREPMNSNCPECNDTGEINLFSSTVPCDCQKRQAATPQTSEKTATQVMAEAFAHPPKTVEELQGGVPSMGGRGEGRARSCCGRLQSPTSKGWGRRQVEVPPHVTKLFNDSLFGQYTAAEICAAQPMTPEGLFQSGLKDVSSERGRQHLEQYKVFADEHEEIAHHLGSQIDKLALWFTTNASEEIREGGAVDNAIAYMERLRAEGTPTSAPRAVITVPLTVTGNLIAGGCKSEASESPPVENNSFLEEPQSDRERAAVAAHMKCMQEERQENEILVQMLEDQMLEDQLSDPPGD